MLEVTRGPKNHLAGRRLSRRALPPPPPFPAMDHIQDCYFDYGRADPSVHIDIYEVTAEPYIVSRIATRYIERYPGSTSQALAAGQDGPIGATNDGDYIIFGAGHDGSG